MKIKNVLKIIFPSNKSEWFLFGLATIGYGILATHIALGYRIIFDWRIPWDAYFSFDNRAIVLTGGGFERHPLANYFFDGLRHLALWISGNKYDSTFRLVLAYSSVLMISLSLLQVFKYLRSIVLLPIELAFPITIFFAMFSTNILLSFTPETYTYTLFLLCLWNHYSASKLVRKEKIYLLALVPSTVLIGGLTITNSVKVFLPLLFEHSLLRKTKNFLITTYQVLISIIVFLLLYLYRLDFDTQKIFDKTADQYEKFSNPKIVPLWDMVLSWFFGGNILFSGFIVRDYHTPKGFEYKALFMNVYNSWLAYVFVLLLLGLILWSYIKNFKNPLVQILALSFVVDITIHCVLKFGLHTSYIYGGHFVFVYPLMLGWLCSAYKNNKWGLSLVLVSIAILAIYLLMSNVYRMFEFYDFINRYYTS